MAKERLGSPRARLFVALELPAEVVEALAGWARHALGPVPELRVVRPESLHVTLVFLGYHAERDIDHIAEVALAEERGAFELTPEAVVGVPRGRPRLLALSLADRGEALVRRQQVLSDRLHAAGLYEPERRPFWPHVTLARVKRGARLPRALALPDLPAALGQPVRTGRVTLFRSTLRPSGAVYEPLARAEG